MIFGACHDRDREQSTRCVRCGNSNAAPFWLYEMDSEIRELTGDFIPQNTHLCMRCRELILDAARATKSKLESKE
jgi:hypothetical protein